MFGKYDVDGDRVLDEKEQMNMIHDLAEENEDLRKILAEKEKQGEDEEEPDEDKAEKKRQRRAEGVMYEDYTLLTNRIDKMESSIGSISKKVTNKKLNFKIKLKWFQFQFLNSIDWFGPEKYRQTSNWFNYLLISFSNLSNSIFKNEQTDASRNTSSAYWGNKMNFYNKKKKTFYIFV